MLATPARFARLATAGSCSLILLALPAHSAPSPGDHLQRSVQLLQQGNLASAEAEARLALEDPKSEPVALALQGSIRLQQQDYQEGTEFLESAIRENPDLVGARLNLAQAYAFLGKHARAEALFREALAQAPANANARLGLARLEARKGNHREALDLALPLEEQLRMSPDGLLLLAECYTGAGERAKARGLIDDWNGL